MSSGGGGWIFIPINFFFFFYIGDVLRLKLMLPGRWKKFVLVVCKPILVFIFGLDQAEKQTLAEQCQAHDVSRTCSKYKNTF